MLLWGMRASACSFEPLWTPLNPFGWDFNAFVPLGPEFGPLRPPYAHPETNGIQPPGCKKMKYFFAKSGEVE